MFSALFESFRNNIGLTVLSVLIFAFVVLLFKLDPDSNPDRLKTSSGGVSAEIPNLKKLDVLDLTEIEDDFSLWEDARYGLGTDTVVVHNKPAQKIKVR